MQTKKAKSDLPNNLDLVLVGVNAKRTRDLSKVWKRIKEQGILVKYNQNQHRSLY